MSFSSSSLVLDFNAYTGEIICPQRQSKGVRSGNPGGQATGPYCPIQVLKMLIEKCCYLPTKVGGVPSSCSHNSHLI